jgi:hypothetical protein
VETPANAKAIVAHRPNRVKKHFILPPNQARTGSDGRTFAA